MHKFLDIFIIINSKKLIFTHEKEKFLFRIFIVIFSVFTILYIIYSFSENVKIGEKAPEFTTQLVNGENYSLSNSKGNYVLLYFWGSWCGPCIRNAPELVAFSDNYSSKFFDKNSKLEILSVALEKKVKNGKRLSISLVLIGNCRLSSSTN